MSQPILESQPKQDTKSATKERARFVAQVSNAGVPDFSKLVADHRAYFLSGATRSAEWRESQLRALHSMMKDHAEDFYAALCSAPFLKPPHCWNNRGTTSFLPAARQWPRSS